MLRIYNTLTHQIEDFQPVNPDLVTLYSCGPTVYDYPHIGNWRTFVFDDLLRRVLEYDGYTVRQVMNITDVGHLVSDADSGEDKMEKGAKREGKTAWEIAKFYTDYFLTSLAKLNIRKPGFLPRATETVAEQIAIIQKLEKNGLTYRIADGLYFDSIKFPSYGALINQTWEELQKSLQAGIRVEMVSGKKHPTDFALWKFTYKGGRSFDSAQDDVAKRRQMEWDSPWGKGFPGWHIECSAMSLKYLGRFPESNAQDSGNQKWLEKVRTIDIHTGGVDHIAIHHTNEIAQSEGATGVKFVNYWVHSEHLLIAKEKISKSLRNFLLLEDLEKKGFNPLDLRYFFFSASYRQKLNFSWETLAAAKKSLANLKAQIISWKDSLERPALSSEKLTKIDDFREKFQNSLNDDLNITQALGVVWEVVKSNLPARDKYELLLNFDEVLGLGLGDMQKEEIEIPEEIKRLVLEREKLKSEKNYSASDIIRDKINKEGYQIEDTPSGPSIKKL